MIEENLAPEHHYLNDYVFHYNPYTAYWNAIPRDVYNEYWSRHDHPSIIKSKDIFTLLEKVNKP